MERDWGTILGEEHVPSIVWVGRQSEATIVRLVGREAKGGTERPVLLVEIADAKLMPAWPALKDETSRGVEVQYSTPLMRQYQEHVQNLEADGGHGEEVDRNKLLDVVVEKLRIPAIQRAVCNMCMQ